MNTNLPIGIINILIKLLANGLKFSFLLTLPVFFSLEEVGIYNLINATVVLFLYIAGIEYFYFANRRIKEIDTSIEHNSIVLSSQFALYLSIHIIALVPVYFYFSTNYSIGIPISIFLISYHINQEVSRILIFIRRPLLSSITLGIGQGLWALPVMIWFLLGQTLNLSTIFIVNSLFLVAGVYVGISRSNIFKYIDYSKIKISEIKKGMRICTPLLVGVLSYKGAEYLGRFMLAENDGAAASGAFSYFQIFGVIIQEIVYLGIITVFIPNLSEFFENPTYELKKKITQKGKHVLLLSISTAFILMIAGTIAGIYIDQLSMFKIFRIEFYLIIISYSVISISFFSATIIQLAQLDRVIAAINFLSAILALILYYVLINKSNLGLMGAAISILIWSIMIFISKSILAARALKLSNQRHLHE